MKVVGGGVSFSSASFCGPGGSMYANSRIAAAAAVPRATAPKIGLGRGILLEGAGKKWRGVMINKRRKLLKYSAGSIS